MSWFQRVLHFLAAVGIFFVIFFDVVTESTEYGVVVLAVLFVIMSLWGIKGEGLLRLGFVIVFTAGTSLFLAQTTIVATLPLAAGVTATAVAIGLVILYQVEKRRWARWIAQRSCLGQLSTYD